MTEETMVVTDNQDNAPDMDGPSLPPGIKTEAVLSYLGNLSNAMREMADGINQTITSIITEGTKTEAEEGEKTNEEG